MLPIPDAPWPANDATQAPANSTDPAAAAPTTTSAGQGAPFPQSWSSHPKVSVIVPAHNAEQGISTLLACLCAQDYPPDAYEILIIDNRSQDRTATVVREWRQRYPRLVHLLEEPHIQGSYAARNRGIRASAGAILAFTDADCLPTPSWLAAGTTALDAAGAGYAAGRVRFVFRSARPNLFEYYDSGTYLRQALYVGKGFGATANLFVRRQVFDAHGLFRADLVWGSGIRSPPVQPG